MRTGSRVVDPAPPVTSDGGGGGGWAWLLTARGVVEAQLVRGVLESNGVVPVVLDATDPSPGSWMFLSGNPNALVRVLVPASMLDQARLAMLETGFVGDDPEPLEEPAARAWGTWKTVVITALVVALYLAAILRKWFA